jgi:phosphate transport system permease protein
MMKATSIVGGALAKPGSRSRFSDAAFRVLVRVCAVILVISVAGIVIELLRASSLSIEKFGLGFLVSQSWNPVTEDFGALSSIFGTLVSTAIAMLLAVPLSLLLALFLVELAHPVVGRIVGGAIELLAAIPSIIYGMWGLFVFAPFMADHVQPAIQGVAGGLPLFQGPPMGIGILTAGIILALMILPFIAAVMRDVFQMAPAVTKESAYGLGSTTIEVARSVTIPYGMQGLIGACFLGLGRAVGETMAVTFVIGNNHSISSSLFDVGSSIASTLANEFSEASEPVYLSALMELGLVLFAITLVIQIIAQFWLKRMASRTGRRA